MSRNCRFALATHITALLAGGKGEPVTSDWLAGSLNTNPVVVRRLLSILAKAGLVHSQRGSSGGSLLTRDPATITLADLHSAVEANDRPATHNQPPNPACPVGARIVPVLDAIIDRAEAARQRELARTSVADVVALLDLHHPAA